MAQGSRVCPQCGCLNGIDEKTCFRCGKPLPGPISTSLTGALGSFSADGAAGTKLMAGMCIVVYGLCMLSDAGRPLVGGGGLSSIPGVVGFSWSTTLRFGALLGSVIDWEPWRILSAVFVHASILHIVMNMFGLLNLGRALEPHFRTARFLILYVVSGFLGFLTTVWWRGEEARSVGASGAIFGLLGAYIGALLIRRNPGWHRVFVSNLILALALAYFSSRIDHAAHVGGFLSGFIMGLVLELEPKPRRRDRLMAVLAGVCVVASLASIVLSAQSPVWKELRRLEEARAMNADSE